MACDIIRAAPDRDDPELIKLHASALIQSGAINTALERLSHLNVGDSQDYEVISLQARAFKHQWLNQENGSPDSPALTSAAAAYARGWAMARRSGNARGQRYCGINTATLHIIKGDRDTANQVLLEVEQACRGRLTGRSGNDADGPDDAGRDHWIYATLGETATIRGNLDEAGRFYEKAVALARAELNSVVIMRRQVRFILRHLGHPPGALDSVFLVPTIGCIVGHLVDQDKSNGRFPETIVRRIRPAIAREIIRHKIEIGFCMPSAGAGILFAEEMLKRRAELNLVLPFPAPRFCRVAVDYGQEDSPWKKRFLRVMEKASSVTCLNDEMGLDSRTQFKYCAAVVDGLARLRARATGSDLEHLAVWDGRAEADLPCTAEVVAKWQRLGRRVRIIDTTLAMSRTGIPPGSPDPRERTGLHPDQNTVAVLFADTVGFSRITDRELPRYLEHFVSLIPRTATELGIRPLARNSWGDALFMVFGTLDEAARYGLQLCANVGATKWRLKGLPNNLNLRVALHAGPAYCLADPVTGGQNYYGYNISRGARIEPITPPGQVYASESFAALAASDGESGFVCEYVGRVPHAKDYGTHPLYHVRQTVGAAAPVAEETDGVARSAGQEGTDSPAKKGA